MHLVSHSITEDTFPWFAAILNIFKMQDDLFLLNLNHFTVSKNKLFLFDSHELDLAHAFPRCSPGVGQARLVVGF